MKSTKDVLKLIKQNKQAFSVPEPDAGFEARMIARLRLQPAMQIKPTWAERWRELLMPKIPTLAFSAMAIILAFLVGTQLSHGPVNSQNMVAQPKVSPKSFPEISSILKKGGERAVKAWVQVNGDTTETITEVASADVNAAQLSDAQQKRILAELEKKWAPAL